MGRRLGIITGINQYQDPAFQPLQFAENDARALAQWLVNAQGGKWLPADVQHVQGTHATRELLESLLTHHCITTVAPDDMILLYFAGHAFVDERTGDGYLACTNTFYQDPSTALHLPSLAHNILARSRASQFLVILDCMQTGPAWQMRRSMPTDYQPLLASTLPYLSGQQNSRLFLCSTRGDAQHPEQGERGLGLFMYRTIVGLCGPASDPASGAITFRNLYTFLSTSLDAQHTPSQFGQERLPITLTGPLPASVAIPSLSQQQAAPFMAATGPYTTPTVSTGTSPIATATMTQQTSLRNTSGLTSAAIVGQQIQQQSATLLEQAQQAMRVQDFYRAFTLANQVLQINPRETSALLLKAQLLSTQGQFQEAFAIVEQLVQVEPQNALAWSLRALLLNNSGQHQLAFTAIQRAIELDGNNSEFYAIKNTIMGTMATAQASGSLKAQQSPTRTVAQPKENSRSFLLGLLVQVGGLVLGIIGASLLILSHLPSLLGLLFLSLGLSFLCVNAARGAYRYGFSRVVLTTLLSLITGAILASILYKPLQTRIFAALGNHPNLFAPLIFTGGWFLLATILPFILALGGLVTGIIRKVRK